MNDSGKISYRYLRTAEEARELAAQERKWAEEDFLERCLRELDTGLLDRATDNGH